MVPLSQAGTHSYEGGAFFVTGLNKSLFSKGIVEAEFAVRPPAMWCGRYGVSKAQIKGLNEDLKIKMNAYLKKKYGPALVVFFTQGRNKLFEDYPAPKVGAYPSESLPKLLVLGDSPTETYEIGVLTGGDFFVYKEESFVRSSMKGYGPHLDGLSQYVEYLQGIREPLYQRLWGCSNIEE